MILKNFYPEKMLKKPRSMMAKFLHQPIMIGLILLAICLQVQVTLFASPDYMGLRVNLADLFLPLMMGGVFISLILKKSDLPRWSVRGMWFWLAGLCAVMFIALMNGYLANGFISNWPLVNKFIGLLILCGYLVLGGWIVQNLKEPAKAIDTFMQVFSGFFVLTVLVSAVFGLLQSHVPFPLWLSDFAWDGFMANRNAFMVVAVFVMIYLMATRRDFSFSRSLWLHHLFWFLMPIFCLYNGSRTGWVCFALILVVYLCRNPFIKLRAILPFIILGAGFACVSFYTDSIPMIEKQRPFYRMVSVATASAFGPDQIVYYVGDQQRFLALEDGVQLYAQSNFFFGAGLGSYKEFQIEKHGAYINLIDFTALWLLVETGALGLSVFTAFFVVCLHALYQVSAKGGDGHAAQRAVLLFLIAFALVSLMHELLYTRFLWFMLGLTLVSEQRKTPE
jgi:hypothetical protein